MSIVSSFKRWKARNTQNTEFNWDEIKRIQQRLFKCVKELWRSFSSAYELTQFFRGTLHYKIVDILQTGKLVSAQDILTAHEFEKLFIEFMVTWLQWMTNDS